MYDKYTVLGAKIRIKTFETPTQPFYLGVCLSHDTTYTVANISDLYERQRTSWRLINAGTSSEVRRISKKYSAKKFFGQKSVMQSDELKGDPDTTNPAENAYFVITYASPDGAVNVTGTLRILCMVTYIVMYTEPKQLDEN